MNDPRQAARYFSENVSQCQNCKNCTNWGTMDGKGWKCKAFDGDIPTDIVMGERSHEENVPEDNGKHYEAKTFKDSLGDYHYTFNGLIVEENF